jgi:hypothetical protein
MRVSTVLDPVPVRGRCEDEAGDELVALSPALTALLKTIPRVGLALA